jgi:hypothetical protein
LKRTQRPLPHLIKVRPQSSDTLRIELVHPPRPGLAIGDQTRILQNPQMLRHRWTAHRQPSRQLIDRHRPIRLTLKDRHASPIAQRIQSGL